MRALAGAALLLLLGGCLARVPVACFQDGTLPGCPTVLAPDKPAPTPQTAASPVPLTPTSGRGLAR